MTAGTARLRRWMRAGPRRLARLRHDVERATATTGSAPDSGRPSRLSALLWWLGTGLLALGLLFVNVGVAVSEFHVTPVVAVLAGLGQSAALVLILIRPTAATLLQFLAVAVFAIGMRGGYAVLQGGGESSPGMPGAVVVVPGR
ncbi:hypothetical protein OHA21_17345 [Actinoplanes sp. NBC_00393]|uniref:hypothetical protein n=1 Tax=Actinoplanes sp. NBC_00393 TaxID=2975953 RepID=UPI002E21400E